jgi:hypothetical protein
MSRSLREVGKAIVVEGTEQRYYVQHVKVIEAALEEAVDDCILEKPDHPLSFIGASLLEKDDVDTSSLNLRLDKPSDDELNLRGTIAQIFERNRIKRIERARRASTNCDSQLPSTGTSTPTPTEDASDDFDLRSISWDTASWLESAGIKELVESSLLDPLKEAVQVEKDADTELVHDAGLEQDFIESLGDHFDEKPIITLLEEAHLLPKLAKKLWHAAKKLKQKHSTAGDEVSETDRASKFFEDGESSGVRGTPPTAVRAPAH